MKKQYIASGLVFLFLLFLGVYHSMKGGINLTDEGLYFSAPFHYRFGVVPFRDAIHNATRQYDLLMAPIFFLFPNITIVQYRILGVVLHLSSVVAGFFLFARLAPPILVACFGAIFFLINNFAGIPSPSYNMLVSTFGTWSFVLWMYSLLAKTRKLQMVLSIVAAFLFYFTVVSNMSAGIVFVIPLSACLYFWIRKKRHFATATGVFIGTVLCLFFFTGVTLLFSGVAPYFWEAILNDAMSSNSSQGGVWVKILRSWEGVLAVRPNSLYLLYAIFGIGMTTLLALRRVSGKFWYGLAAAGGLIFVAFLYPMLRFPSFDLTLVVLSVLCIPVVLLTLFKRSETERTILIPALLWSIIQVVSYAMLSTNGLQSGVKGAMFLFFVVMISLYDIFRSTFGIFFIATVIALFFTRAVGVYTGTNYLEVDPEKLTGVFRHPRLAGISSVPEKITALESLLAYLKNRVKPGDYFLAYNDLPLLYYLTDTRPLYPNVWSFEAWWPFSYRQKLFEKMLAKKETAPYAVHMVTNPGYLWGTPVVEGRSYEQKEPGVCLLCQYVADHYVLEQFIFPFEIWRYGKGEKYEFLKNFRLNYEESFDTWPKETRTIQPGDMIPISPFQIDAVHGTYAMDTRVEAGESIARFTYEGPSSVYPSNLDITHFSASGGLSYVPKGGEDVAATAMVRLSRRRSEHPYYSALFFIQDRYDEIDKKTYVTNEEATMGYPALIHKDSLFWKTNSVAIYNAEWQEYAVERVVRNEAFQLNFGISWVPLLPGDWIEIKNIRFYTNGQE